MFNKYQTLYCPICDACLGSHNRIGVVIVTCPVEDCAVKWCWKPKAEKPVALDYPGKKQPKPCKCEGCKGRTS